MLHFSIQSGTNPESNESPLTTKEVSSHSSWLVQLLRLAKYDQPATVWPRGWNRPQSAAAAAAFFSFRELSTSDAPASLSIPDWSPLRPFLLLLLLFFSSFSFTGSIDATDDTPAESAAAAAFLSFFSFRELSTSDAPASLLIPDWSPLPAFLLLLLLFFFSFSSYLDFTVT